MSPCFIFPMVITSPRTTITSCASPSSSPLPLCSLPRRVFLHLALLAPHLPLPSLAAESEPPAFQVYNGPISLGFSFSYPASWAVKKKPIRTHLSEVIVTDPNNSYTSAGIVVDAVKIDAIDNFGTPELVADRVVSMETKKDSVNSAFVHSAKSFVNADLTYYVLDYTVDSSRGVKRYLAKATVTARNLYVFTAQTKAENFDSSTEQVLSKMLQSFTVVKQYT